MRGKSHRQVLSYGRGLKAPKHDDSPWPKIIPLAKQKNADTLRNSSADPNAAHLGRATGKPPASRKSREAQCVSISQKLRPT